MTKSERAVLDAIFERSFCEPSEHPRSETFYEEALAIFDAFRRERATGHAPGFAPGELVQFCRKLATPIRVRGEFLHLVPYESCMSTIDDAAILARAIAEGRAGKLELAEDRKRIVLL
jgi:hypothetical protein